MKNEDFEEMRPYNDSEVSQVIEKLIQDEYFSKFIVFAFPKFDLETIRQSLINITTVKDFQLFVMQPIFNNIISLSVEKLTSSGFEKLSDDRKCMFISNHRDIVLDTGFLQRFLYEHNLDTTEITFGSNLMNDHFFTQIGKLNKMFKINRGGTPREIFLNSMLVSKYMRYAITEKNQSVWIAQKNGRTKNGNDETEIAVLKMFSMSSKKDFVANFDEINITPISISYEFEPCDFLKTRELYISKRQKYIKTKNEDFNSIFQGINQWKGNVHLTVCESITVDELNFCNSFDGNKKFLQLAEIIDQRIHSNYKLWKNNYIAYDLLMQNNEFQSFYNNEDKEAFCEYANKGLQNIEGDSDELKDIFLQIYANPVKNSVKVNKKGLK